MKKRLICVFLIGFLMVFTAGVAFAQKPADQKVYKWKFQSHWPAGSASFKPLKDYFEQNLTKMTNGRLADYASSSRIFGSIQGYIRCRPPRHNRRGNGSTNLLDEYRSHCRSGGQLSDDLS